MTNKEALVAVLRVSVPDDSLEKALLDQSIPSGATYTKEDAKNIDLCAVEVLSGLLSEPDVSEGGFSISYDRKAINERLIFLAKKHNLTTVLSQFKPSVTSKNVW